MKVVVLIPAYNEADLIKCTVEAALHIPGVSQVVVIDDGSRDGTGLRRQAPVWWDFLATGGKVQH